MTLPCTTMNLENQTSHLVLLILFIAVPLCTSIDTITRSRSIRDGEILVSSGESFALGFFGRGNSSNRYVGIWYNKDPGQSIVWVANRDSPINDTSGLMSIDETGNLVIDREASSTRTRTGVWSTNLSSSTAARSAQLLDSGNLELFGSENGEQRTVAWQSFDYPTNTMLPQMKLGVNRRTGLNRFLTSWKSSDDPGTGEYTYDMNISGPPQLMIRSGTARLWRTGPWNGLGWSGVPAMTDEYILNISYVDDENEVSFMVSTYNASIFSMMVLNESGKLAGLTWNEGDRRWVEYWSAPGDACDRYGHCGPNSECSLDLGEFECTCLPGYEPRRAREWYLRDGSGGCVRKRAQACGDGDGFVAVASVTVPDTSTAHMEKGAGLKECERKCLRNCSCFGYAVQDVRRASGCMTWNGELLDTKGISNGGQDLFIRVDALELAQYSKLKGNGGKKRMVVILVVSLVVGSFLIILSAYWLLLKGKKRRGTWLLAPTSSDYTWKKKQLKEIAKTEELKFYDLSTIVDATDNFSSANMLGQGGFGPVYKGQLGNEQEIAVKRLSKNSGQGIEEFKNEVALIAKLQHRNLVRLIGCCIQKDEKMLIYEYLPKKGLDCFIFDKAKGPLLDWRKRFDIILGIVRGLLYLHQDSRLRIIHRDLKASNVLLDAVMNPKISDFGMARMFGGDQTEANTNRIVGTYGYMSPEYAMQGLFSIKSDVFSFGVLLLEIISGKKNTNFHDQNSMNLIGHVWELWREGKALDIVDSSLGKSYPVHEVLRCIHIALLCVQESAIDRPTMSVVASMLSNEATLSPPKQPAFILNSSCMPQNSTSTSDVASSVNEVTVTMVDGR